MSVHRPHSRRSGPTATGRIPRKVFSFFWLACSACATIAHVSWGQPPGLPPSPVVVAVVVEQTVVGSQPFVGTVMARNRATIGTAVAGRLIEVLVEEGDAVKARQPLARLLTATIELEIAAAKAELDLRQQELLELQNGARPEELRQAQARLRSMQARMDYERKRQERISKLYNQQQATSAEERDEAVSAEAAAIEAYEDAKAGLELTVAGPRAEQIAQAKARVDIQQAIYERLQDQLSKHTMISQFDGFVTAKYAERGQWLNQGDPVVEVSYLDEVDVIVSVVEQNVPFIHLGEHVPVRVASIPDQILDGTVVAVIPKGDDRARTFPVKVRVQNITADGQPSLKAGMLASVSLPTGSPRPSLMVPKDAIVLGGEAPLVYVVQPSGREGAPDLAQPVPVQLGLANEDWIQVLGSLNVGDRVVVQGNERLRPGQPVMVARTVPATTKQSAEDSET